MASAHGTRSRYVAGCRCQPCRQADRAYQNDQRHARFDNRILDEDFREKARVPTEMHGKCSTYANYGCRCTDCTTAKCQYDRARRARRKAAA